MPAWVISKVLFTLYFHRTNVRAPANRYNDKAFMWFWQVNPLALREERPFKQSAGFAKSVLNE